MKKVIFAFAVLLAAASLAGAATRTGEFRLEIPETSGIMSPKAMVNPVDEELYNDVLTHVNDYVAYLNTTGAAISETRVNQWMAMNKKFFTNQQLMSISETLSGLDEENYQNLVLVDYKDPRHSGSRPLLYREDRRRSRQAPDLRRSWGLVAD